MRKTTPQSFGLGHGLQRFFGFAPDSSSQLNFEHLTTASGFFEQLLESMKRD
jgi:hypothetical protein